MMALVDSSDFDKKAYFKTLVAENSLSELLAKRNAWKQGKQLAMFRLALYCFFLNMT